MFVACEEDRRRSSDALCTSVWPSQGRVPGFPEPPPPLFSTMKLVLFQAKNKKKFRKTSCGIPEGIQVICDVIAGA